jgi:hypothetical protein
MDFINPIKNLLDFKNLEGLILSIKINGYFNSSSVAKVESCLLLKEKSTGAEIGVAPTVQVVPAARAAPEPNVPVVAPVQIN